MKKMVGLVVIVAALVLGSYYGMGLITERTLKKNLEVINQPNGIAVHIKHYHRGWFKSTALLNWHLHLPSRVVKNQNGESTTISAKDYDIQMPLAIYHGPIIVANSKVKFGLGYASTDVVLPATYEAQLDELYTTASKKPTLNVCIFVTYLNNSRLHMYVPDFKLIAKKGDSEFDWLGFTSDVTLSSRLDQVDGQLTINGITLTKNTMKAALGKVSSNYKLHLTESGLYLGDADLSMPSLLVKQGEQTILDVNQLSVQSSSDVVNGLFASQFKVSLQKLFANGKTYGPSHIAMSLKNIDALVLAQLNDEISKMQQGSDSDRQRALFSILPELPKLLNKGAAFEISDLKVDMPQGAFKGNLLISLPNEINLNPFQLLQKLQGQGKLLVTAALLKDLVKDSLKQKANASLASPSAQVQPASDVTTQATDKIAALEKSGLLVLKGLDYQIELKLAEGKLQINGKPFTSDMMQF